jgi:AcrR family transcriptional regulator
MAFIRARSEDEKQIRINEIKKAAVKLFDNAVYQDITLSRIGKEINFTRVNLYKYVTTKEDIYLLVLVDELEEFVNVLEEDLLTDVHLSPVNFTKKWANLLTQRKRFMKLLSIHFSIVEPKASLNALIEFKNSLQKYKVRIFQIFKHNFPSLSNENTLKVLDYAISLIVSRYPFSFPSEKQQKATELSHSNYIFPSFEESYGEFLRLVIEGLLYDKTSQI